MTTTTTHRPAERTDDDRRLDELAAQADDGAARLAMDVESIADDALRATVPLDVGAAAASLEISGGGVQALHASNAFDIRVEVLASPGPGTVRVELGDTVYVVLEGNGALGVEGSGPLALVAGEAAVVRAGARHLIFGNPRLRLLVVSAPGWISAPLALCRRT